MQTKIRMSRMKILPYDHGDSVVTEQRIVFPRLHYTTHHHILPNLSAFASMFWVDVYDPLIYLTGLPVGWWSVIGI